MKLKVVAYWDERRKRRMFTLCSSEVSYSKWRPDPPMINGQPLIFPTAEQAQHFASLLREGDLDGSTISPEFFYH